MTTATQQSLLERFNNAEGKQNHNGETYYPDREKLEWELEQLLQQEQNNWKENRYFQLEPNKIEDVKNLIALYKQVFDWDTQYSLDVEYSLSPSTMYYSLVIDSKEELNDYLTGKKEIEHPDCEDACWEKIDYGYDIESEDGVLADIVVKNLRIKEKVNNYSIVLSVESKEDNDFIEPQGCS